MDMMKQVKRWIAVAVCVLASSTALAVASSGKPLARMANGELIGEQDLADYLERRMDLRGIARNVWGVEQVVREMALTRVLNLEGESLGIPVAVVVKQPCGLTMRTGWGYRVSRSLFVSARRMIGRRASILMKTPKRSWCLLRRGCSG